MNRRTVLRSGVVATAVGLPGCGRAVEKLGHRPPDGTQAETPPPNDGRSDGARSSPPNLATASTVGGTLNGRPRLLGDTFDLLEHSTATWLHSFLDVRGKHDDGIDPRSDPDVEALRRLARRTDTRLVITLQWDFKGTFGEKDKERVPPPGSTRETTLFDHATALLDAVGSPPEIIVLGNEPMWETPEKDLHGTDVAIVPFTRNLKDHLLSHYPTGESRILVGAINRLRDGYLKRVFPAFRRQFFEMARTEDAVDGVDLHVHYGRFAEAEEMVATAREEVPDGIITTTEFSPAGRYKEFKDVPIDRWAAGTQFLERFDLPDGMTAREYFGKAVETPRPPGEIGRFYEAMPWYNLEFVEDMYDLLNEYDVSVGTTRFMLGPGFDNGNWPWNWQSFPINSLYQDPLISSDLGAHPHYLEDFRRRSTDLPRR